MTKKSCTTVAENDPMYVDYLHKLTDEQKKYLYKFSGEMHLGVFTGKPLHRKKSRKELLGNRNAKRRDVLTVSETETQNLKPRRGRYSEADYNQELVKNPEDTLVALIDIIHAV